jgi:flavorubredoxin
MLPMAGATLTYLKSLRPTGKAGIAFGSYGWGRGGPEAVDEWLKSMKFEMLDDPLKSKYKPTEETLAECREIGERLARKALELAG